MSQMLAQGLVHFEARLKLPHGKILAAGIAEVVTETQSVVFHSEFVPLYPIGTELEITRLWNGRVVHRFLGSVFLSDKKLLRLTGVRDVLLPGAEEIYCGNLPFTGQVTHTPPASKKSSLFGRRPKEEAPVTASVSITELTREKVVFLYPGQEVLDAGQRLLLTPDPPLPLPPVAVALEKALFFGEKCPYLCRFTDLSPADTEVLGEFLRAYCMCHCKLF